MILGVDFGITVTDAVKVSQGSCSQHLSVVPPDPTLSSDPQVVLARIVASYENQGERLSLIAVTGGRSRELPSEHHGVPLLLVSEPTATARGALALSASDRALVVSCGTGTAIVHADRTSGTYRHVTGTAVGGGTLAGLGALLLDGAAATKVAELALVGEASGVDTTLADVLGGALGHLPASATAVNFGRVPSLTRAPAAADVAAGLTTMVGQTIALLALNAAKANEAERVVFVGRTSQFEAIAAMIRAVFTLYSFPSEPLFPAAAEQATAFGAALVAEDEAGDR